MDRKVGEPSLRTNRQEMMKKATRVRMVELSRRVVTRQAYMGDDLGMGVLPIRQPTCILTEIDLGLKIVLDSDVVHEIMMDRCQLQRARDIRGECRYRSGRCDVFPIYLHSSTRFFPLSRHLRDYPTFFLPS